MAQREPNGPHSLPDRFDGTHPDPVPDGGVLTVLYADPERGGQTIEVDATDRDDATESQRLEVTLRGNGKGSQLFIVPVGWGGVVLTSAGSRPHVVNVALPP
jgi:hypothetical protein